MVGQWVVVEFPDEWQVCYVVEVFEAPGMAVALWRRSGALNVSFVPVGACSPNIPPRLACRVGSESDVRGFNGWWRKNRLGALEMACLFALDAAADSEIVARN